VLQVRNLDRSDAFMAVLQGTESVIARCATVNFGVSEATNVNEVEQRRAARKRYQPQYRALYDELVDILFQLDPISVHAGETEKFVPEATTIMARLREARVAEDVEQIVLQELRRWYGRRRLASQDPDRITDATIAICHAWNRFLQLSAS
jgi:hypothetical protein